MKAVHIQLESTSNKGTFYAHPILNSYCYTRLLKDVLHRKLLFSCQHVQLQNSILTFYVILAQKIYIIFMVNLNNRKEHWLHLNLQKWKTVYCSPQTWLQEDLIFQMLITLYNMILPIQLSRIYIEQGEHVVVQAIKKERVCFS